MFIKTLEHIAETYVNFPTYFVGALITVVMLYFARRIQTYYEFNVKKYHEIEDADISFFLAFLGSAIWPLVVFVLIFIIMFYIIEWVSSFIVNRFTKQ